MGLSAETTRRKVLLKLPDARLFQLEQIPITNIQKAAVLP